MGFFDSILGTNTSQHQSNAMVSEDGAIGGVINGNNTILGNQAGLAQGDLKQQAGGALGALQSGYTGAQGLVGQYGGAAQGALTNGVNAAVGTVQGSNAQFQPYATQGAAASGLYGDSLGLNGAGGDAAAQSAFQASPGYQYQVDQATDAASRKAASLGMAGSGNTLDAITRLGSNLANQEYGNWQSSLNGLSGQGLQASSAISGNNAAAGNMEYGGAGTLASLINGQGTSLAGYNANLGTTSAGVDTGLGTGLANIDTGLGSALTSNNQWGRGLITGNVMNTSQQQDATQNANNGIFSKLIGSVAGAGLKAFGV